MNPRSSNSTLPRTGRSAYGVATAVFLLAIPLVVAYGGVWLQDFLNFGAGVVTLVLLTCSVIWGLVAQDRLILNTRQRIVAQGVHRITAVGSIAFLLLHIGIKITLEHTTWIAAFIPFGLGFSSSGGLIGLGTLAGQLMIFVGITGALRNRFASPAPVAARWRAMHMLAYPAWCAGLVHGLYAGRAVKAPIFTYMYALCVLGVIVALALRAAPRPFKRRITDRVAVLLGAEERGGRAEELEASRARRAAETAGPARESRGEGRRGAESGGRRSESALPGYEGLSQTGSNPIYQTPAPEPAGSGFAAAYRAMSPGGQQPYDTGQTARMDMPMDMQAATEPIARAEGIGSTSGNWPIPSPPPVGEAPPSAYDPLQDTGYNIPTYGGNSGTASYLTGDVRDTGESNTMYGAYNPNDTYNSGPATDQTSGQSYDFDSPGSGEPWNTPSGGYR